MQTFGIIGSGSWATALTKVLTDNNQKVNWLVRNASMANHIVQRHHNPNYLSSVYFNQGLISLFTNVREVVEKSDIILIAVPSAYVVETLQALSAGAFLHKKIISAVKGILPNNNLLVNEYLQQQFLVDVTKYYTLMGPCHAEEIAAEKLSYLTFSGVDIKETAVIASCFKTDYLNTVVNQDVYGVQFAAILKNIYALGAGIAHGLEYGDNFLSVFIANTADEMAGFVKTIVLHSHYPQPLAMQQPNYNASVYLGDLLVTCYSLYSRNRTFGNMIGKGYSVQSAQLEMNMIAEGYNASKCMFLINQNIGAAIPIAEIIYKILWQKLPPAEGFKRIEEKLV